MDKESCFVHKHCKLVKADRFVLFGVPIEISDAGVVFETTQKTSFICWHDIKELSLREG